MWLQCLGGSCVGRRHRRNTATPSSRAPLPFICFSLLLSACALSLFAFFFFAASPLVLCTLTGRGIEEVVRRIHDEHCKNIVFRFGYVYVCVCSVPRALAGLHFSPRSLRGFFSSLSDDGRHRKTAFDGRRGTDKNYFCLCFLSLSLGLRSSFISDPPTLPSRLRCTGLPS
jgi:hypothetical protein